MAESREVETIADFEGRVACLRIAHGPGCAMIGQMALAGLSDRHRGLVVLEAVRRQRAAKVQREIKAGTRKDHEVFLNNLADALLRLPDGERARRLARCPKVLRTHVAPVIAEYLADRRDFLAQAGIASQVILAD